MQQDLHIIPTGLLPQYKKQVKINLQTAFDVLEDAGISTAAFSFYTTVSAIASSRIEGEQMEVDSYLKHKMHSAEYQPDLVQKPDDLYQAYIFAQQNELTPENFLATHRLITAHLLPQSRQGAFRTGNMVVMEHRTGRIQFEAAPAGELKRLMDLLWQDIELLKTQPLSYTEIFYFASFIHLVFVNIHPFEDGNGRAGRLLKNGLLRKKPGEKAWYLQSEPNYYNHVADYYKSLNRLGHFL